MTERKAGKRVSNQRYLTKVTSDVKAFLAALPTEQELQEFEADLTKLIEALTSLRDLSRKLSTSMAVERWYDEIRQIEHINRQLTNNRVGQTWLGVKKPPARSAKSTKNVPLDDSEREQGRRDAEELQGLPLESINTRLGNNKDFPRRRLEGIALAVGLQSINQYNREALARQIANRIANVRGYEALRGGSGRDFSSS